MNSDRPAATERSSDDQTNTDSRRQFLALGASVGATLLAGCSSGSSPGTSDGEATANDASSGADDGETAGTFRLLISDQPVAIDEFDSLEVSLDRARIFRGGSEDEDGTTTATATSDGNETATATATPDGNETATTTSTAIPDDDAEQGGFSVVGLDGATVDLTRVIGDDAITVFDGELPAGRYTKIELYAADVEGVVDGDAVEVKIPSGKLQITKPFEVSADEPVDFVFDINVVKRGQSGGYTLLPVISESGVAGKDVSVNEIGDRTGRSGQGNGTPENASESGSGNGDGQRPTETEESS